MFRVSALGNAQIKGKLKAMAEAMATESDYEKSRNDAFWPTHLDRLKFVSSVSSLQIFSDENIELMKAIVCNPKPFVKQYTLDLFKENRYLSQVQCNKPTV